MTRVKQKLRIERKHPRVEIGIHCVVGLPDSDLSAGKILDLSTGGLKFSCGRRTIYNILPDNKRTPGLVTGIVVEMHFEVELPDLTALAVKCNVRLVYFERLAQDDFHVGAQFTRIDKTVKKALLTYLESTPEILDKQ